MLDRAGEPSGGSSAVLGPFNDLHLLYAARPRAAHVRGGEGDGQQLHPPRRRDGPDLRGRRGLAAAAGLDRARPGGGPGAPVRPPGRWRAPGDAVRSAAPEDRVLLGGVMGVSSQGWLGRMFDTPGADARHRFDIANLHLRAPLIALQASLMAFRAFLAGRGFHGPLWLTEHGYPGAPDFQSDPAYRGGEQAQAHYLRQSLPTLVRAGAAQAFVTLRDGTPAEFGNSAYTSEGLLHVGSSTPYTVRLKPAFALVQWLARLWPRLPATARDLDRWRTQLRVEEPLVRAYLRRGYRERKLARRYRGRARRAKKARSRHRYLRAAARHDRRYALYTQRIAGHVAAARLLSSLIAGYREGP